MHPRQDGHRGGAVPTWRSSPSPLSHSRSVTDDGVPRPPMDCWTSCLAPGGRLSSSPGRPLPGQAHHGSDPPLLDHAARASCTSCPVDLARHVGLAGVPPAGRVSLPDSVNGLSRRPTVVCSSASLPISFIGATRRPTLSPLCGNCPTVKVSNELLRLLLGEHYGRVPAEITWLGI